MVTLSAPLVAEQVGDWQLEVQGFDPLQERVIESLFSLSNGYVGTRASLPEGHRASNSGTFVAGVFDRFDIPGPVPELVKLPDWLRLEITVEGDPISLDCGEILDHRRTLDMRRGLCIREWRQRDLSGRITRLRFLHCVSLADRRAMLQRVEICAENYSGRISIELRVDGSQAFAREVDRDLIIGAAQPAMPEPAVHLVPLCIENQMLAVRTQGSAIAVALAPGSALQSEAVDLESHTHTGDGWIGRRWEWTAEFGRLYRLDKLMSIATSRTEGDPLEAARRHLAALNERGSEALLAGHEQTWEQRWQAAALDLDGEPSMQRALRFAAYHLIAAVNPEDEHVSIGARGLTGEAYKGHVFWDTELFMLPFYLLTDPAAARALLMYRFHTLPAARRKAARLGYRGALYAWESTDTGEEATPDAVIGADGIIIPIANGRLEQHISGDVAFAVWQYWRATRDAEFLQTAGAEMLLETARFWCSRASLGADGRDHIRNVIGPDEYHDGVDDNAYTNILARWNLQRGLEVADLLAERWPQCWHELRARLHLTPEELAEWRTVAHGLVDGLDPHTGLYEQFAGYFGLDDIDLGAYAAYRVPIDVILGHDRVRRSKVVKQADVLMALYLLGSEIPESVQRANLRYYEPKTAHGSSLSPGIHAAFAARLGEMDLACECLKRAAAVDLDDQMGNASGGVHLAALGSLWQAAVFGFAGVELTDDELRLQPQLPPGWRELRLPLIWRGRTLRVQVSGEQAGYQIALEQGAPLSLTAGGAVQVRLTEGTTYTSERPGAACALREEDQP